MVFHGIPIGSIWTAVKWLPGTTLRRIFPKHRLADLQYVDLRPRHDPVTVDLGESSTFSIWLAAINLSPFEVELDRAEFEFWYLADIVDALADVIADGNRQDVTWRNPDPKIYQLSNWFRFQEAVTAHLNQCWAMLQPHREAA